MFSLFAGEEESEAAELVSKTGKKKSSVTGWFKEENTEANVVKKESGF